MKLKVGNLFAIYIGYDWSMDRSGILLYFKMIETDPVVIPYKYAIQIYWNSGVSYCELNPFHNDDTAIPSEAWTGIKTSPISTKTYWKDLVSIHTWGFRK